MAREASHVNASLERLKNNGSRDGIMGLTTPPIIFAIGFSFDNKRKDSVSERLLLYNAIFNWFSLSN